MFVCPTPPPPGGEEQWASVTAANVTPNIYLFVRLVVCVCECMCDSVCVSLCVCIISALYSLTIASFFWNWISLLNCHDCFLFQHLFVLHFICSFILELGLTPKNLTDMMNHGSLSATPPWFTGRLLDHIINVISDTRQVSDSSNVDV